MSRQSTELGDFEAFYRETSRDLLAFLTRRCATPEDAADYMAETYLLAWGKRDALPSRSQLRPWLFGVARNVMRRGHERDGRLISTTNALAEALRAADATHHEAAAAQTSELADALAQLSPLDREIITMIAWDGLTPAEVGLILGISANVSRVRVHRARARLRALVTTC